ncbi:MAG: CoB--CoM heterodisulfide reductase iron-sulfur subunit A family protein [Thermoplasmata archaeon]
MTTGALGAPAGRKEGGGARVAVFLCTCKSELGKHLDMERLAPAISELPGVAMVRVQEALCVPEGQKEMVEAWKASGADRVVVGACTPNIQGLIMRDALERAGLNRYLYEQVNIRELCGWVHGDRAVATEKALRLLKAAVARSAELEPLQDVELAVVPEALVVGGGVAGMEAALCIAERGFRVHLVERSDRLGGRAYSLSVTFPTHNCGICCMQYCKECVLTPKVESVLQNPRVNVYLCSEVESIEGGFGDRRIRLRTPGGPVELRVGTIVVACGSDVFDARRIPEYGYGVYKDVVTTMDLEKMLAREREFLGRLVRPSTGEVPRRVNFIQCVGSRDRVKGNLHCSLVCCTYAIGQAREIRKLHPQTEVFVHYIDLRGPYRGFEEFCEQAKAEGVVFVRGRVSEVRETKEGLRIRFEDTDLGKVLDMPTDLVVLAVGQEPAAGSKELAKLLHLQLDQDGFIKDLNPNFPAEYRRGVFVAGCAEGPKGIRYSIEDAKIAASAAADMMAAGRIRKTRAIAVVDEERCRGCGRCEELCEYGAAKVVEKGGRMVSVRDEARCEGCGACAAQCCSRAIQIKHFTRPQMEAEMRELLERAGSREKGGGGRAGEGAA